MMKELKDIKVYIDENNNVYSNPRGIDLSGITSNCLNIWDVLLAPYDNEMLESFLLDSLEKSFSREAKWYGVSPEETLFRAKSWVQAVKGLKQVHIIWSTIDGEARYTIFPSKWNKRHGGHFEGVSGAYGEGRNNHYKEFGENLEKGELAKEFLRAIELSTPATGR